MIIRRRSTRVLAWGAATAVTLSTMALTGANTALASAPSAPSTLSPNSSIDAHKNVQLSWTAVSGATSYDVQILDDDNPDLARVFTAHTTVPRYTAPVQLPDAQYRWRVRAVSSSGAGAWSSMATLTRGWEDAVTGLSSVDEQVPTLSWNPLPDASFYEVEISRESFRSPQYSRKNSFVCWTAQTTYTPYGVTLGADFDKAPGSMNACALAAGSSGVADPKTSLIYGDTYYWRVRGRDGTVDDRTTPFPTPSATCLAPWLDSGLVVTDNGSGGTVITVPVGETAPDSVGAPSCSDWSQESTFVPTFSGITEVTAVAPTGLVASPLAAGSTTRVTGDPTFHWDAVPGALFYRLYVSRDRQIGALDLAASTQATSLTPASGLGLTSTDQYWAVQACTLPPGAVPTDGTDDNQIDCGPISAVQTISQVTTNPAAPSSFTDQGSYLLATWTTGAAQRAAAKAYDVAVTQAETGTTTTTRLDRVADLTTNGTSRLVIPTAALSEGTYSFRVRPVAENDRYTAWSAASSAVVLDRAAPTVKLTSAAGFVDRTPVTLTFSEGVSNVSSSTVGVATSSGSKVAGTVTKLSSTQYRFTPSAAWVTGGYYRAWTSGVVDRASKPATAASTLVRASTTADSAGQAIRWVSGDGSWLTRTASDAYARSYRSTVDRSTTSARSYATASVYGSTLAVSFCRSPQSGYLRVYVDGHLKTTVSQYRSWSGCGGSVVVSGLTKGTHSVTLQAVGSGSRTAVSVDRISVA